MSEALQERRRIEKAKDWTASVITALALAVLAALVLELLLSVAGWAMRDGDWHRNWLENRLQESLAWLKGAPLIGGLASMLAHPETGWLPSPGRLRDIVVLSFLLFTPCLWAGARIGPALIARYDGEAFRRPPPADLEMRWAGPLGSVQERAWAELDAWCHAGIGDGHTPFWRPFVLPNVPERFSVAVLVGENGGGKSHLAEAFARQLDHSDELTQLAARSRLQAWWRQLSIRWHELWWWRTRHPQQPWDCGFLVEDPATKARLAQFRPRKPTLIIADELRDGSLDFALHALGAARVAFRHPVRLLVIDVALPNALAQQFDAVSQQWKTPVHALGIAPVISFTDARFQPAEMRALVSAHPSLGDESRRHLMGKDAEWTDVTTALDELPILVAEALRWVRQEGLRYEELQRAAKLPLLGDTLATRLDQRNTPELPPDALGKQRELLRERVLRDRATHRQASLQRALGTAGDMAYHALMVATAAGGGSAARLTQLLGLQANPLSHTRLETAFGQHLPRNWVPSIKPTIIADELLRRHFDAPFGAELSPETQERLQTLMRQAWMLNPTGALHTVTRWQKHRQPDAFAQALQTLPTLADLHGSQDTDLRIDQVRAFVELAVHQGGHTASAIEDALIQARAALDALTAAEWPRAQQKLLPPLLRRDASGVPALILWLDLQRLNFPSEDAIARVTQAEIEALGLRLAGEAMHLLRQCALVSVPVDIALEDMLDDAAFAALPLLTRLSNALASSEAFAERVLELSIHSLGMGTKGATGQPNRLRARLLRSLPTAVAKGLEKSVDAQSLAHWGWSAIGNLDRNSVQLPALDELLASSGLNNAFLKGGAFRSGKPDLKTILTAQTIALWCRGSTSANETLRGLERLAPIARAFPDDPEIQYQVALAWCVQADLLIGSDSRAMQQATQRVAEIARSFERHKDFQHLAAMTWRRLAWAHKDSDAQVTEKAARHAADIAKEFKQYEGIQREAAEAWRLLAWAHRNTNVHATEREVQKVADIARCFEWHEGIQHEAAMAWRFLAWAHQNTDTQATEDAVQKVADIARHFKWHEGMQSEAAEAWRRLAEAHHNTNVHDAEEAAHNLASIAEDHLQRGDIQYNAAATWRLLAWAHKDTDARATEQAAKKAADIANSFESTSSKATLDRHHLAEAHNNTAALASEKTALATHLVNIQFEAAVAWRLVAWAHRDSDAQATERATLKVAEIANKFGQDNILFEAAQAWNFTVQAAVKFFDEAQIDRAMKALDELVEIKRSFLAQPVHRLLVSGRIQAERQSAIDTVAAWRIRRGKGV